MEENKKIGILTFSYSSNGGSIMQALALQKTISQMDGYKAYIINYTKDHYGKPVIGYNVFTKPLKSWTLKKIAMWIGRILTYPIKMKKYKKFFKEYYNGFSKRTYSREELVGLNDVYDKFVVGSDQVWNYGSPQVDDTYFLDFVKDNSKKIAYAASFGQNSIPLEKRENAKKLILDFSSISVREPDGVDIVSELTGRKAAWVLDPSLLLEKQEYQKLSAPPKKKGYVYLYLRQESERLEAFAKKLAAAKGLSVIKVSGNWLCGKNGKQQFSIDPHKWLGYIENADYVVTNSFHGICFSIIFEKEFYVDFLKKSTFVTNSRLEGMLKQFDLLERHIDEVKDIDLLTEIYYEKVNEKKESRKKESITYLKQALERRSLSE